MRNNPEYILCKQLAVYLRLQYPRVIFHFDYAGLNLSKAQAGQMKAIQGDRGYPDLFIAQPIGKCAGLFIELKADGTKLLNRKDEYATPHIAEQAEMMMKLEQAGYAATFAIGFTQAVTIIDGYLNPKNK